MPMIDMPLFMTPMMKAPMTAPTILPTPPVTAAPPTDEEQAEAGVVAFYKELDAVAAGKARLDSFKHATVNGETGEGTRVKWQALLSNQLASGRKQSGLTRVTNISAKPVKDIGDSAAWMVTACVDRSEVVLKDKAGNEVKDAGSQDRATVQHTVIEAGGFRVLYDEPGKSC